MSQQGVIRRQTLAAPNGQAARTGRSRMRRRRKLTIGSAVIGALVVSGLGFSAAVSAFGAQASVTTVARAASHSSAAVPTPKRRPAFDATFGGSKLNTKVWDTCYPKLANYNHGCTNWGNSMEAEWYLASQVKVSGGVVRLIARRERTVGATSTGARKVYGCRSGMITSYPGFKFEYGFVQVVAKIPHANGLWPALWLAAADGKYPPEMDMLESWGVNTLTASFFHPVNGKRSRAEYSPALTRGWQTYSLSWTRTRIRYYVGSRLVLTITKKVPHQRMYFIANVAEYLPAKAGRCSGQLDIRSVKIWKS
jgi:beta-glucanase (GH16 family)